MFDTLILQSTQIVKMVDFGENKTTSVITMAWI